MKKIGFNVVGYFIVWLFTACASQVEGPVVQAVYPSSNNVPENLLRIYIQFSSPMKTTDNLEKISLIDEDGAEVKNVFFNNVYELWNHEQTQLTLILDPARVKQGLKVHESYGRAIKPSRDYTLRISGMEDVNHQPLKSSFEKKLSVVEADFKEPDLSLWEFFIPGADSKEPFMIKFPTMLDYQSLTHRLVIKKGSDKSIKGEIMILDGETKWSFMPDQPWEDGMYTLYINTRLEDPSGNNLNGLFDHKSGSLKYEREGEIESISFEIGKQGYHLNKISSENLDLVKL